MLIEKMHYDAPPEPFEIRRNGSKAVVLFPTEVEEITVTYTEYHAPDPDPVPSGDDEAQEGEGYEEYEEYEATGDDEEVAPEPEPINFEPVEVTKTEYLAHKVYVIETTYTPNLADRIKVDFDEWLALAKIPEPAKTTIPDLEEAINALTEIVLGGE